MEQRISLITLGVRDMAGVAAFYEALGWQRVETQDGVIAFDLLGQTLGLYPLEKLAEDIGIAVEDMGRGGTTFSYNVRDKGEVAPLLAQAEAAGGRILRAASDVFWGGHIGYFADPEGNIWEVSHNPYSPLSGEGAFRWNGY
ncbi:VOC family protein [uncultured Sulfitobacter sp.]|uniref:VOC family protein n=1 Tax=uncultured Sulfitobacter sp. TaxID=191468 RepID=UPI002627B460|nr:VOC family protein [uncultured Sulfitobacter sp.]